LSEIISELNTTSSKHTNEAPLRTSLYGDDLGSNSSSSSSNSTLNLSASEEDQFKHLKDGEEESK
jgi:hypothetical protein